MENRLNWSHSNTKSNMNFTVGHPVIFFKYATNTSIWHEIIAVIGQHSLFSSWKDDLPHWSSLNQLNIAVSLAVSPRNVCCKRATGSVKVKFEIFNNQNYFTSISNWTFNFPNNSVSCCLKKIEIYLQGSHIQHFTV